MRFDRENKEKVGYAWMVISRMQVDIRSWSTPPSTPNSVCIICFYNLDHIPGKNSIDKATINATFISDLLNNVKSNHCNNVIVSRFQLAHVTQRLVDTAT